MNALRPTDPRSAAAAVDAVRTDRTAARDTPAGSQASASSKAEDQVQISAEARARAAESRPSEGTSPEIETARVALRSESLSDARLHELRERVRTGHYNQPDVIARVAGQAAADLAPE